MLPSSLSTSLYNEDLTLVKLRGEVAVTTLKRVPSYYIYSVSLLVNFIHSNYISKIHQSKNGLKILPLGNTYTEIDTQPL